MSSVPPGGKRRAGDCYQFACRRARSEVMVSDVRVGEAKPQVRRKVPYLALFHGFKKKG